MKKIAIIGSHGIPARYGGFETFAEHLAVSLAKSGHQVTVVNEKEHRAEWSFPGINILHSSYNKSQSPLSYYKSSIEAVRGHDFIIVCGSAGSLFYNTIRNSTIITNIDGLEHNRGRYSWLQRKAVYFLQKLAIRKSDVVIVDSQQILEYWSSILSGQKSKMKMIAYGADECLPFENHILEKYDLKRNEYFLVIARLVPENNIADIIHAYKHYKSNKKLVVVGNVDSDYSKKLREYSDSRVIFTQAIYEKSELDSLRAGCYLYIHGHSVGGTNPSLLEAMAAKCACLCHDNEFNRETTDDKQEYFKESFDLAIHLNSLEHNSKRIEDLKNASAKRIMDFSWEKLTKNYLDIIGEVK